MMNPLKHVPTTIIGLIIGVACVVLIYTGKATLTECSIAIPAILISLGYRPNQGTEEK